MRKQGRVAWFPGPHPRGAYFPALCARAQSSVPRVLDVFVVVVVLEFSRRPALSRLSPVRAARIQPGVSVALPPVTGNKKKIPLPREEARGWALPMMNDE